MVSILSKEFQFYLRNQRRLVKKFNGRVLVIKDKKVIGNYGTETEAIQETQKQGHKLGTFLVQKCEPGPDSYTQVLRSRASAIV